MKSMVLAGFAMGAMVAGSAHAEGRYIAGALEYAGSTDYDYAVPVANARIEVDADSAVGAAIAYGQQFGKFRGEIGLSYASRDAKSKLSAAGQSADLEDNGSVKLTTLEFTGYYDFPSKGRFQPYVGVGAGLVSAKLNDGRIDDSTTAAKIQGIVGASVSVGRSTAIFGDVRLSRVGSISVESTNALTGAKTSSDIDLTSTDFRVGVSKSF